MAERDEDQRERDEDEIAKEFEDDLELGEGEDEPEPGEGDDEPGEDEGDDDAAAVEEAEIEAKARRKGWIPEDEWEGSWAQKQGRKKPARFYTAQEFLERNSRGVGKLREDIAERDTRIDDLQKRLTDMGEQNAKTAKLVEWQAKRARKIEEEAYQRGIEEQKKAMRQAVQDADEEAFDEAERKLDELQKAKPDLPPVEDDEPGGEDEQGKRQTGREQERPQADPDTEEFMRRNASWFQDQERIYLNSFMIQRYNKRRAARPDESVAASLAAAKREVMDKFPEDFGMSDGRQRRRGNGSTVADPRPAAAGNGKTPEARFAQLPREDREAFKMQQAMFKEKGVDYTVKEFMEEYRFD